MTLALVICALGALTTVAALRLARLGGETWRFTRAEGRVVDAHVEETPGPSEQGGPRFTPVLRYRFEARGRAWESERVSAGTSAAVATPDAEQARRELERHPAGSAVVVWFDPADPRRSVLVRGAARAQVVSALVVGLVLLAIGLFLLLR